MMKISDTNINGFVQNEQNAKFQLKKAGSDRNATELDKMLW